MMKLKYIVNNTDRAAELLLANWDHDPGSAVFCRASSNYVHAFKLEGQWRFLRFSRVEERDLPVLESEVEYLLYLKSRGFKAAWPVLSINSRYIEAAEDQFGRYYGLVFQRANGTCLSPAEKDARHFHVWGCNLALLHNLAQDFAPQTNKREDYSCWLNRFESAFAHWNEREALAELGRVRQGLDSLEKTKANFGLVHYDFQDDNLFWNQDEEVFYAIDFDDAHYHFYAMDLHYALEDVMAERRDAQQCQQLFLAGYQTQRGIDPACQRQSHLFARYSELMHFYRIMHSLEDSDPALDPDWLIQLRPRLVQRCDSLRQGFAAK